MPRTTEELLKAAEKAYLRLLSVHQMEQLISELSAKLREAEEVTICFDKPVVAYLPTPPKKEN